MCWNQLLLAGLSTGSVYFLTVPSDHTVPTLPMLFCTRRTKTKLQKQKKILLGKVSYKNIAIGTTDPGIRVRNLSKSFS